jgi:hypothetical protein
MALLTTSAKLRCCLAAVMQEVRGLHDKESLTPSEIGAQSLATRSAAYLVSTTGVS